MTFPIKKNCRKMENGKFIVLNEAIEEIINLACWSKFLLSFIIGNTHLIKSICFLFKNGKRSSSNLNINNSLMIVFTTFLKLLNEEKVGSKLKLLSLSKSGKNNVVLSSSVISSFLQILYTVSFNKNIIASWILSLLSPNDEFKMSSSSYINSIGIELKSLTFKKFSSFYYT